MQFPRAAAAALLLAFACPPFPAAAQGGTALATDRYAPTYLLDFWRSHGPGATIGNDPSENAPGWFRDAPPFHVHQPSYGPRIAAAEASLLRRRLDVAFRALMSQPSLKDIRGASLAADINVAVVPTSDGRRLVSASLGFIAKRIIIGDPKTFALQGRYETPWLEGATLKVVLNPYEFVSDRDVSAEGAAGRALVVRTGAALGMIVADVPHQGDWNTRDEEPKLARDRSWYKPGSGGAHPLLVHYSSHAHENRDLLAGKLKPTAPVARLAAAMFMTDWEAVQRDMAAVK